MADNTQISLRDQIAELKRELAMRKQVYPSLIDRGKLKRVDANRQNMTMKAALKTLMRLEEQNTGKQINLELQ